MRFTVWLSQYSRWRPRSRPVKSSSSPMIKFVFASVVRVMALSALTALSPLDGRYHAKVAPLRALFSESGLIRFRVLLEVEWLKALAAERAIAEVAPFSSATVRQLDELVSRFSESDATAVQAIEAHTNHASKAIEYFLKDRLAGYAGISVAPGFTHFA